MAIRARSAACRTGNSLSPWVGILFFGVFMVAGMLIAANWTVPTLLKTMESQSWPEVPCVVVASSVQTHSGESTTYSIRIVYEYNFSGERFQSDRFNLIGGSSSGKKGKQRIVDAHPPGLRRVCYVNPDQPAEAVLQPGFSPASLILLFPLPFLLVGWVGCAVMVRKLMLGGKMPRQARLAAGYPFAATETGVKPPGIESGELDLKPALGRWSQILILLMVALFWNGIVLLAVSKVAGQWSGSTGDYITAAFLSLFVLIGLALLGGIIYSLLALRNPRARCKLAPGDPRLGGQFRFSWSLDGDPTRFRELKIYLQCSEKASRRSGKNTSTQRKPIHKTEIFSQTDRFSMRSGQCKALIPPDAMHSFKSLACEIQWSIRLHGKIDGWPDLRTEFPIWVQPAQ